MKRRLVLWAILAVGIVVSILPLLLTKRTPTEARVMGRATSREWKYDARLGVDTLQPSYFIVVQREDCPGFLLIPVGEVAYEENSHVGTMLRVNDSPCSAWRTIYSLELVADKDR